MFATLDTIKLKGMKALVRADLNVPVHNAVVGDLTRLERLKPTLDRLIAEGARVVVMSHLAVPKVKNFELSPESVARALSKVLDGRSNLRPIVLALSQKILQALEQGQDRKFLKIRAFTLVKRLIVLFLQQHLLSWLMFM